MRLTPEVLHDLYLEQGLSAVQIAERYGVSRHAVYKWLKQAGISVRNPKPPASAKLSRPGCAELRRLYQEEGRTVAALAKQYQVRTVKIKEWLADCGIAVRPRGYGASHALRHPRPARYGLYESYVLRRARAKDLADHYDVTVSTILRWLKSYDITAEDRIPPDEELRRLYVDKRWDIARIAEAYEVSAGTAHRWLLQAGVPMRGPGGRDRPVRPPNRELRWMYVNEGMSMPEMAGLVGVRATAIREWLVEAGVTIREPGKSARPTGLKRPTPERLRHWYFEELLSTEEIADLWGVRSSSTIRRWLHEAGVELRPPGRSLQSRGLHPPTEEELRRLVWEEHLGYRDIAELYGGDPSAVAWWLRKYNIPTPTTWDTIRKGVSPDLPTTEQLRARYDAGESLKAIADDYPVSWQTIRELAIDFGIRLRPTGWYFGPPIECADGHVVRSTYERRVDDWLSSHGIAHEVEPPVPFDSRWRADFKVGATYIEVWGVRGQPSYEEKKRAKIAAFEAHGVSLIEMPYWIFGQRSRDAFERRLAPLLSTDIPQLGLRTSIT